MRNGWITDNFGNKFHYKNDKLHNINDEPAVIWSNGYQSWYKNGKLHRDNDKPAVTYPDGEKWWCQNGLYHRTNGPAITKLNGAKSYWINGKKLHKEEFDKQSQQLISESGNKTNKDYPHTCPNCKSPAYISFLNEIDCSRKCK